MKLSEMLINNFVGSSVSNSSGLKDTAFKTDSSNFESYLNKTHENKNVSSQLNSRNNKNDKVSRKANGNNNDLKFDENKNLLNKNSNVSKKVEISEKDTEKTEEDVISEIAAELGISEEEVQEILQILGLSIIDLVEPNNLLTFMQKVFDVSTAIELLSIDNVKDIMSNVKDLAENFNDYEEQLNIEVVEELQDIEEEPVKLDEVIEEATQEIDKEVVNIEDDFQKEDVAQEKVSNEQVNETDSKVEIVKSEGNEAFRQSDFDDDRDSFMQSPEEDYTNGNIIMDNISKAFDDIVVKNESLRNVDAPHVMEQIIQKVKVDFSAEFTEMKINLKPENLGDVALKIAIQNGVITALMTAENQKVKEIIESNFNLLKDALNEQGIEVSQLEVNVGNQNESDNNPANNNYSQEKSDRRINDLVEKAFAQEVEEETDVTYVAESEVLDAKVNYTA